MTTGGFGDGSAHRGGAACADRQMFVSIAANRRMQRIFGSPVTRDQYHSPACERRDLPSSPPRSGRVKRPDRQAVRVDVSLPVST